MGIFDLPAPLFAWADQAMSGFAPPTVRLILWGLVAAVFSMGLYWLFSPSGKAERRQDPSPRCAAGS